MKLIKLMKAEPIRDAEFKISGWSETVVMINPQNIQGCSLLQELGKVELSLVNGKNVLVSETMDEIAKAFAQASQMFELQPIAAPASPFLR